MYSFSHLIKIKLKNVFNHIIVRSKSRRSHYEVLNLKRNCTSKQIKESFIKLSKENHPDLNKNLDAHKKFLAINESYKVLSNTESRRNYDLGLIPVNEVATSDPQVYTRYKSSAWTDQSFYANRDKNKDGFYENKPYYGVKGQQKVSNLKIVALCILITIIGVGLQIFLITTSITFQRDQLLKKSQEAQDSLNSLKQTVNKNGNELQLEILKLKLAERYKKVEPNPRPNQNFTK